MILMPTHLPWTVILIMRSLMNAILKKFTKTVVAKKKFHTKPETAGIAENAGFGNVSLRTTIS